MAYLSIEQFFIDVEKKAFHFARFALNHHEQALDVVQDSMEAMLRHYADKPQQEWHALFFSIVRNKVNDIRRKQKSRSSVSLVSELSTADTKQDIIEKTPSLLQSPEQGIVNAELSSTLNNAVNQLAERQREVFLLREAMQYSIKETCELLDLTPGTVKQHHFRALKQLRKLLAEVWSDD